MSRKKVTLAYMQDDSKRKISLNKRKKGLIKKAKELSTLCGVDVCAIIYSPNDPNPEVWPPTNSDVRNIISRFRKVPDTDRQKRMFDHQSFVQKSLDKATENVLKQNRQNMELEMKEVMLRCVYGNMEMPRLSYDGFRELKKVIDRYFKDINRAIEVFQSSGMEIGESSAAAAHVAPPSEGNMLMAAPSYEFGSSSSSSAALFNPIHHQQQQQFAYPAAPQVGLYYPQLQNLSLNPNQNQNQQQLFMAMMNQPEQMMYHHNRNQVQLQEQQHHPHHHQITGESSSTVLDAANPSSSNPVTSSTTTNNSFWFL